MFSKQTKNIKVTQLFRCKRLDKTLKSTPRWRLMTRSDVMCKQRIPSTGITLYTRKNAQVVTNLQQTCSNAVPTTCQQDVFALLVPSLLTSCQRLVDKLLQDC
jgi:hypothetical protein